MNTRSLCTIASMVTARRALQTGSSFSALIESDSLRRSRLQAPLRREDTSVCSKEPPKEVAHSRYRVNDAIPLRQRSQTLSRAHLRSSDLLMLL
jgi:hypothetical protein